MSAGKLESTDWRTIGERTRRQLEELDALLERMLALPPLDAPEGTDAAPVESSKPASFVSYQSRAVNTSPTSGSDSASSQLSPDAQRTSDTSISLSGGSAPSPIAETTEASRQANQYSHADSQTGPAQEAVPPSQVPSPSEQPLLLTSAEAPSPASKTATQRTEAKANEAQVSQGKADSTQSPEKDQARRLEKGPAWLLREEPVSDISARADAESSVDAGQPSEKLRTSQPASLLDKFVWISFAGKALWHAGKWCWTSPTVVNWLGWLGLLLLLGSAALWLGVWLSWHW